MNCTNCNDNIAQYGSRYSSLAYKGINNSYIKLDKFSNIKIKLMNNASCTSFNLIYIIMCKKCKIYYIGETGKTLKTRISQHFYHIY